MLKDVHETAAVFAMEKLLFEIHAIQIARLKYKNIRSCLEQKIRRVVSLAQYKVATFPVKKQIKYKKKIKEIEQLMSELCWYQSDCYDIKPSTLRGIFEDLSELGNIFSENSKQNESTLAIKQSSSQEKPALEINDDTITQQQSRILKSPKNPTSTVLAEKLVVVPIPGKQQQQLLLQ
jgi:hypothetical protein